MAPRPHRAERAAMPFSAPEKGGDALGEETAVGRSRTESGRSDKESPDADARRPYAQAQKIAAGRWQDGRLVEELLADRRPNEPLRIRQRCEFCVPTRYGLGTNTCPGSSPKPAPRTPLSRWQPCRLPLLRPRAALAAPIRGPWIPCRAAGSLRPTAPGRAAQLAPLDHAQLPALDSHHRDREAERGHPLDARAFELDVQSIERDAPWNGGRGAEVFSVAGRRCGGRTRAPVGPPATADAPAAGSRPCCCWPR
jgi:hypothetical protein